jgi:hypothetical protein
MDLGSMLTMGFSKEKVDRFSWRKLRPTVHLRGRDRSSRGKKERTAYSKLLTQGLPQTPVLVRVARTAGTIREQPGEENSPDVAVLSNSSSFSSEILPIRPIFTRRAEASE